MYSKKGLTGRLNTKFHNPRCIIKDFRTIGRKWGGGSHGRNNQFISRKWRRNLKRGYIQNFIVLSGKLKIYDKHKKVVECRCNGSCHICVRLKTTVFVQHMHVAHCPLGFLISRGFKFPGKSGFFLQFPGLPGISRVFKYSF